MRKLSSGSVVSTLAVALASFGCNAINGLGDLQVTDQDCVKGCPDTGAGDTPSDTPPATGTITVEPAEALLFIDTGTSPVTPATQAYKATLKLSDGTTKDVTSTATFTIDDTTMGSFAGPAFTSPTSLPGKAATTLVHASAEGATGSARLSVVAMNKSTDFFVTAPKDAAATPAKTTLLSNAKIAQIDLAIVEDTTGSMTGAINNVKTGLAGTLFPNISKAIPDPALAVVDHRDYPVSPYGQVTPPDWPVKVLQTMTKDVTLLTTAANTMVAGGGGDLPEAQISAMQHTLTGEALNWGSGSLPAHMPPAGTSGAVEFRNNSLQVVTLITDIDWHDEGHTPYSGFTAPTMVTLKAAFAKAAAKFIDITNGLGPGFPTGPSPEDQANDLSDATGSNVPVAAFEGKCGAGQCCTGMDSAPRPPNGAVCRLNFQHKNGDGVSQAIVNAVNAMSKGLSFAGGIGAFLSNDPLNAGDVDVTKMVTVRAMDEGTSDCLARTAKDTDGDMVKDTFNGPIGVDNKICFELATTNTTVAATDKPQFFVGYVDVLGSPGSVRLERRMVVLMVPHS